MRFGVPATVAGDQLDGHGNNLALVLNDIQDNPAKQRIDVYLRRLLESYRNVYAKVRDGSVVIRMDEDGINLPGARLSDGTLRFLCLMAALFHPESAPLICIKEPEIGLHPDALQLVAEALREASERTQLIVTTHSEALVDALSENPESVVICEKDFDHSTQFRRLDSERLTKWLEDYHLGELWRRGEIGGNRW